MKALGTIVRSIGSKIYEYAISLEGGVSLLIQNGDEELHKGDYGKQVIVEYDPQDDFCTFKAFYAEEDTLERLFDSGKIEETVQQLITEAVKVSNSCLDEAIQEVFSDKASEINNGGKEAQIRFLVQEYGVHAIPIIREFLVQEYGVHAIPMIRELIKEED